MTTAHKHMPSPYAFCETCGVDLRPPYMHAKTDKALSDMLKLTAERLNMAANCIHNMGNPAEAAAIRKHVSEARALSTPTQGA